MSEASYKQLVGRLATDPDFAAWVRAHPDGLTQPQFGFDLSSDEAASLSALAASGVESAPAAAGAAPVALETRRSKSGLAAGGAAAAAAAGGGGYYLYSSTRGGGNAGGRFSLDLASQHLGQVWSVEGGNAGATVVNEKIGPDGLTRKHIAGVKYEDIALEIGLDMGRPIYDWISQTWSNNYQRRDGAIVSADYNSKAVSQLNFYHALISEVGFPALDVSSKEPAKMTVKLAPEFTKAVPPTSQAPGNNTPPAKKWLASNFKLEIDGLDTSNVLRIDPFAVSQVFTAGVVGDLRTSHPEPAHIEVPSLRVTVASSRAADWVKWHDDFLVRGNNGRDRQKNGVLRFLSADMKEIGRIDMKGLGIFRLADARGGAQSPPGLVADLFCTTMDLHVGGPQAAAPEQPSTPSSSPTASPSPSPSASNASPSPSASATASAKPTASASASASPTATPAAPSATPTATPGGAPKPTPTPTPKPTP